MQSLRLLAFVAAALGSIAISSPAFAIDTAPATRYVWARSLMLRAQPDGKSAQLAKIPYGAALAIGASTDKSVPHSETIGKFTNDDKTNTVVTIDGAWQKVHWQDKDGWVFDGFLSRFPAPADKMDADETLFAIKQFGAGKKWSWNDKQSRKLPAYAEMLKTMHAGGYTADLGKTDGWEWTKQEFSGNAYFASYSGYNDGSSSGEGYHNLPISFNEAILWAQHFHDITNFTNNKLETSPVNQVTFDAGKRLSVTYLGDNDGSTRTVSCTATTCDIEDSGGD